MKKTMSILAVSAILSAGLAVNDAHAQSTYTTKALKSSVKNIDQKRPYYYYNGYFKASSKLLLEPSFINAIAQDNVSFNGFELNKQRMMDGTRADKVVKVRDITLGVDTNSKSAIRTIILPVEKQTIKYATFKAKHPQLKLTGKDTINKSTKVYKYSTKNNGALFVKVVSGYITEISLF